MRVSYHLRTKIATAAASHFAVRVVGATLSSAWVEAGDGRGSFIDVAISAIIGLVALVRFANFVLQEPGNSQSRMIHLIRGPWVVLLAATLIYLGIKLAVP